MSSDTSKLSGVSDGQEPATEAEGASNAIQQELFVAPKPVDDGAQLSSADITDEQDYIMAVNTEMEKLVSYIELNERYILDKNIPDDVRFMSRHAVRKAWVMLDRFVEFKATLEMSHDTPVITADDVARLYDITIKKSGKVKSLFQDIQAMKANGWKQPIARPPIAKPAVMNNPASTQACKYVPSLDSLTACCAQQMGEVSKPTVLRHPKKQIIEIKKGDMAKESSKHMVSIIMAGAGDNLASTSDNMASARYHTASSNSMACASDNSNNMARASDDSNNMARASDDSNKMASDDSNKVASASDDSNKVASASDDSNKVASASDDSNKVASASDDSNKMASDDSNKMASDDSNKMASDDSNKMASDDSNKMASDDCNKMASASDDSNKSRSGDNVASGNNMGSDNIESGRDIMAKASDIMAHTKNMARGGETMASGNNMAKGTDKMASASDNETSANDNMASAISDKMVSSNDTGSAGDNMASTSDSITRADVHMPCGDNMASDENEMKGDENVIDDKRKQAA